MSRPEPNAPARRAGATISGRTVVDWLSGLSDRAFAQVFTDAIARRSSSGLADWRAHYALVEVERVGDGPWVLEYIAAPREGGDDPDVTVICQSGTCRGCGVVVRSWGRAATCPVCARVVYTS